MVYQIEMPLIGERCFHASHEVWVINRYDVFGLVKVKYRYSGEESIVNYRALSGMPDVTKTISMGLLGGSK